MIIFVNDIPVTILKPGEKPDSGRFNHTIDANVESITQAKLINHVLVSNVNETHFDSLLGFLNSKVPTNILSLVILVEDYEAIKRFLNDKFKIVKAAGGL